MFLYVFLYQYLRVGRYSHGNVFNPDAEVVVLVISRFLENDTQYLLLF